MTKYKLYFLILMLFISINYGARIKVKGIPEYSKDLPESLKNYCNVCHEKASGGPLNNFGKDYMVYGTITEALKEMDSDGDSFNNGVELTAGTLPGFDNSYPGSKRGHDFRLVVLVITLLIGSAYLLWKRRSV